jgi:hypothetical protein
VVLALKRKQQEEERSNLLIKEEEDENNDNTKYKRSEKNKDRFVEFSDFCDLITTRKYESPSLYKVFSK